MVTFSCKDGWNIWWLFLLALGSTQNQGAYFLPFPLLPSFLIYVMMGIEPRVSHPPNPSNYLFLKQPMGPVEADFQYREVPCCLGDLIQFFRLFPLCVVPFV